MDLQLGGKRALVTRSTAGIGFAIANRLAAEGATVTICGRDQAKLGDVLPGPTRSEGIVEFIRSVVDNKDAPEAEREAAFFAKMRPLSLIRRLIEADEIAAQVALLASPWGAITNGAAVRVEGGIVPTIA